MLSVKFRGKRDKLESQASKIESGQTVLDNARCVFFELHHVASVQGELKYCGTMLAVTEGTQ